MSLFFETAFAKEHTVRNSAKVVIVLGVSFLLVAAETWLKGIIPMSGLLAVVSMACVIKIKSVPFVSKRLSIVQTILKSILNSRIPPTCKILSARFGAWD